MSRSACWVVTAIALVFAAGTATAEVKPKVTKLDEVPNTYHAGLDLTAEFLQQVACDTLQNYYGK